MPAFFKSDVARFLQAPTETVVGALSAALIKGFSGDHSRQLAAWRAQVEILRSALGHVIVPNANAATWDVLFEFPLLRLQRRLDIVLLARSRVVVLEFKVGASAYQTEDVQQVEDYALDLSDLHEASHHLAILPVLCATRAPDRGWAVGDANGVAETVLCNERTRASAWNADRHQHGRVDRA